jgi:hypothetical protein
MNSLAERSFTDEIYTIADKIQWLEPYQYEYVYGVSCIVRLVNHCINHEYYPDLKALPKLRKPCWPLARPSPKLVSPVYWFRPN